MPKRQPLLILLTSVALAGAPFTFAQVPTNMPSQLQPGILQQETPHFNPEHASASFSDGVFHYRQGQHQQALGIFEHLHQTDPHNAKLAYYLAITHTQLGHADQARSFYLQTLALASSHHGPSNEAGKLAELAGQGLQNLPPVDTSSLDTPPNLNALNAQVTAGNPQYGPIQQSSHSNSNPQVSQQPTQQYGMSQQDMAMLQMMMNGQNNGGMNPLMMMGGMVPGQGGYGNSQNNQNTNNPYGQMDPSIMSNMMMNQMLQNFSFGVDKKDR